jgi:hypothetical protein
VAGHVADHAVGLAAGQPVQGQHGQMGARGPGRLERGSRREHGEQGRRRRLLDQEAQELQRRGIDPVQVFDDEQRGLVAGPREHHRQQGLERPLPLALGAHRERRIPVVREGQGQEGCQQHQGLVASEPVSGQERLELAEPALGCVPGRPSRGGPEASRSRDGADCSGRGRSPAPRAWHGLGQASLEDLQEARLADPGLAAQEDDLPVAVEGLLSNPGGGRAPAPARRAA